MREFELQRMKESEIIKGYSNILFDITNKVKLLGTTFADSKIIEIFFVTMPKRYVAPITTFENTKDLSKISLAEVIQALQAKNKGD